MSNAASDKSPSSPPLGSITLPKKVKLQPWHTFEDILYQLHQDGILLHPHQLAEFLIVHGLPVDLRYVPDRLQDRAIFINHHYQGDMAQLDAIDESPWFSYLLLQS